MKKKLVITLLLTALATTSLAGCGKKETATDVPTESTEVVAEINTEAETEEIVVAETETEEFELFFKTEAENTEKSDEKTTNTKETASNSGNTSTEKSTDKSADKSTSNTSSSTGNTSSGSTSTSTTASGNTGSTNSGTTNSTTTETAPSAQPETPVAETPAETPVAETPAETPVETPAPEPELPSFPYELNTLYENGDGTGCIYIYDTVEDNNDGLMHGMTSDEYSVYDWEQTKKIEAVGGMVTTAERLGHYKEGYIRKVNYVPNPYK